MYSYYNSTNKSTLTRRVIQAMHLTFFECIGTKNNICKVENSHEGLNVSAFLLRSRDRIAPSLYIMTP